MKIQNISKVCAAVALTLSAASISTAIAAPAKSLNDLGSLTTEAANGRYIVTFKNNAHNALSKTGQSVFNATSARSAMQKNGAKVKVELSKHRAIAAELNGKALAALQNDPNVASVVVDAKRYASSLYENDAGNPNDTQVTPYAIYQSQANQLSLQSGQKVCVIDSGLDASNPDFDRSVKTVG